MFFSYWSKIAYFGNPTNKKLLKRWLHKQANELIETTGISYLPAKLRRKYPNNVPYTNLDQAIVTIRGIGRKPNEIPSWPERAAKRASQLTDLRGLGFAETSDLTNKARQVFTQKHNPPRLRKAFSGVPGTNVHPTKIYQPLPDFNKSNGINLSDQKVHPLIIKQLSFTYDPKDLRLISNPEKLGNEIIPNRIFDSASKVAKRKYRVTKKQIDDRDPVVYGLLGKMNLVKQVPTDDFNPSIKPFNMSEYNRKISEYLNQERFY